MLKLTTALVLILSIMIFQVAAQTYTQANPTALHLVRKIYVEAMGTSAEASRFRLLLQDQLTGQGFTVVDRSEMADAVLGGALSVDEPSIYGCDSDIGVTARLTAGAGERLWLYNIGGQITILNPVKSLKFKEPIEYRAKELAKRLRKDWEKSARAAGVKVSR